MKRAITCDEMYPFYTLDEEGDFWCDFEVDVPDDLADRYERAWGLFFAVQEELAEIYRKATGR